MAIYSHTKPGLQTPWKHLINAMDRCRGETGYQKEVSARTWGHGQPCGATVVGGALVPPPGRQRQGMPKEIPHSSLAWTPAAPLSLSATNAPDPALCPASATVHGTPANAPARCPHARGARQPQALSCPCCVLETRPPRCKICPDGAGNGAWGQVSAYDTGSGHLPIHLRPPPSSSMDPDDHQCCHNCHELSPGRGHLLRGGQVTASIRLAAVITMNLFVVT